MRANIAAEKRSSIMKSVEVLLRGVRTKVRIPLKKSHAIAPHHAARRLDTGNFRSESTACARHVQPEAHLRESRHHCE